MLDLLAKSCKFNFMLQTFENLLEKIFYLICVPFLATTEEERELYDSSYNEFIKISEEVIELGE
jgi:hypothetical protein